MRSLFIPLFSCLSVLFFSKCDKEKPEPDPITVSCDKRTNKLEEVKQLIVGKYEWAYTIEYPRLQPIEVHTPENTGTTNRYVFDKEGNARYYENNKLIWDRRYEVDYELRVTSYYLDSAAVVIIKNKETQQREEHFRAYLCNDSALFHRPSSVDYFKNYQRLR